MAYFLYYIIVEWKLVKKGDLKKKDNIRPDFWCGLPLQP